MHKVGSLRGVCELPRTEYKQGSGRQHHMTLHDITLGTNIVNNFVVASATLLQCEWWKEEGGSGLVVGVGVSG